MGMTPPPRQTRYVAQPGKWHHMYDARWRKAREIHLARWPLCVTCEARGVTRQATDVDHIRPHRGDPVAFWDSGNWQSLCGECHKAKTAAGL